MPRLLIVKTSSLGDVIHNLPAIADMRAQVPDLIIDWVVEESFADIPAMHLGVDNVIPLALRRWRKHLFSRETWREIAAFRQKLSAHRYDWVLDTQGLLKSVLIASWTHGPLHGYGWGSGREPLPALFYAHRHKVLWEQHAVVRIRKLAALALGYPLPQTFPDYGLRAPAQMLPDGLPRRYIVAFHGTSRDSKLWPVEQWVALGRKLAGQGITLLLPWGNATEHARAEAIAAQVAGAIVLPRLPLSDLAAILGGAMAAVGVDTGLIHLAAALNLPTVAIYTDTDPALTGVLGTNPNRYVNLGGIGQTPSSESVMAALSRFISQKS
jgi:heptosyltransferase I